MGLFWRMNFDPGSSATSQIKNSIKSHVKPQVVTEFGRVKKVLKRVTKTIPATDYSLKHMNVLTWAPHYSFDPTCLQAKDKTKTVNKGAKERRSEEKERAENKRGLEDRNTLGATTDC